MKQKVIYSVNAHLISENLFMQPMSIYLANAYLFAKADLFGEYPFTWQKPTYAMNVYLFGE